MSIRTERSDLSANAPLDEPLAVKPKRAMIKLDCGRTRLYQLLNAGELDSFKDGKSRKITTASIHAYIQRCLKQSGQGARHD